MEDIASILLPRWSVRQARCEGSHRACASFFYHGAIFENGGLGYPIGRPGYAADHVVPPKRGGSDTPCNMHWQTKEAAKAQDWRE